jgi:hypothetical protein
MPASVIAASVDCTPSAQVSTIGRVLSGAIPPSSSSSRLRQIHAAPGTWPRA